jgi:predicted  nucleic acid-binding Zn-ribbon protein
LRLRRPLCDDWANECQHSHPGINEEPIRVKAELAQLIALQKTDTNIRTLQTEIESIPERRAEIEREFDQRAFEIRGLEQKRGSRKRSLNRSKRPNAPTGI